MVCQGINSSLIDPDIIFYYYYFFFMFIIILKFIAIQKCVKKLVIMTYFEFIQATRSDVGFKF